MDTGPEAGLPGKHGEGQCAGCSFASGAAVVNREPLLEEPLCSSTEVRLDGTVTDHVSQLAQICFLKLDHACVEYHFRGEISNSSPSRGCWSTEPRKLLLGAVMLIPERRTGNPRQLDSLHFTYLLTNNLHKFSCYCFMFMEWYINCEVGFRVLIIEIW